MAAKFQTPIQIATAPKKYKPVRRCIYCGRRSGKISTEHILAFGLAADSLVLPSASCRRCSEKTRDFETACLRHMWWPFRTSIGAPSRGKEKPDSFLLRTAKVTSVSEDGYIQYDDKMESSVAPAEYPLYYFAYKFPQPGALVGRAPRANITYEAWMAYSEQEMRKAVKEDREAVRLGPGVPEAFCRLLAKTAHSYAVAEIGLDGFSPLLCGFIRSHEEQAFEWVGGDDVVPPATSALHDICWKVRVVGPTSYVVVSLRLFSFLGTPQYHIVVGELNRPLEQLPFLEQPLYSIHLKSPLPRFEFVPLTHTIKTAWR